MNLKRRSANQSMGHLTRLLTCAGLLLAGSSRSACLVDNFDDGIFSGWTIQTIGSRVTNGTFAEVDGQLQIQGLFGETNPENAGQTIMAAYHNATSVGVADGQRLELRVDMILSNQDDAFAYLGYDLIDGSPSGYALAKDQTEILLYKYGGGGGPRFFFWDEMAMQTNPVTLLLGFELTAPQTLQIRVAVLDRFDRDRVLYDRTVVDGPGADPTLPDRSRKGLHMTPDNSPPWAGPEGLVFLGHWHLGPLNPDLAEVRFDNLMACELGPALEIHRATLPNELLLLWPQTTPTFEVMGAANFNGSWNQVTGDLTQSNGMNILRILQSGNSAYFRLQR